MINVETYFLKQHKLRLRYPELPVVQVTAKAFYPMEVCNVWVGSNFFKKLNAQQTSDMLKSRCEFSSSLLSSES